MKTCQFFAFFFAVFFLTGCAQMGTRQTDTNTTTRYEIKGGKTNAITTEVRETTTRAKGTAVISGKTALEGFQANQDGKKQGLEIKKTSQQTDGLRDAVEMLRLMRDLGGMAYGMPPAQSAQPTRTAPAGMKWILAPKDDPSEPQPEE
jgi:hypothetical protein